MQREYPYIVIRYSAYLQAKDGNGFILEYHDPDVRVGDPYDNEWETRLIKGLRFPNLHALGRSLDYKTSHLTPKETIPEEDYPIGA